jgi:hypothetical protein
VSPNPRFPSPAKAGSSFDFVLGPANGEKHGIFAKRSVHLVQGSSGNGKTTLGLQMLYAQRRGDTFFGRQGLKRNFRVVWQDRNFSELERQLDGMGLLDDPPPTSVWHGHEPDEALITTMENFPETEVLFVEGLDLWCEDAKDMKHVATLATNVRDVAEHYHISIIATVGMPKMKPREKYAAPRDRAFGSSAWARKADTVVDILVPEDDDQREVQVLSRTGKAQRLTFRWENGVLVPVVPAITVGPVDEAVGKVTAMPTIKDLKRTHRCSTAKAQQLQKEQEKDVHNAPRAAEDADRASD